MANNATVRINLVDQFSATAQRIRSRTEGMSRSLQKMSRDAESVTKRMTQLGKSVEGVGKKLSTRLSLPVAAVGAIALKTATSFESSMLEVKAVSRATEEEFKSLAQTARDTAKVHVSTATDAAGAQKFLSQGGLKVIEVNRALIGTLDLAAATQIDVAKAADVVVTTLNTFNLEASETTRIADQIALTSSDAATNIDLLSLGLGNVGIAANQANFGIEQTLSSLAVLSDNAAKGGRGGTALRVILSALVAPLGQARNAIKEVGLETRNMDGSFRDVFDIFEDLSNLSFKPEREDEFFKVVFGQLGAAPAKALVENLDLLRKKTDELGDSVLGTARQMAEINISGVAGAIKLLGSAVEEAQIEFFDEETLKFFRKIIISVRDIVVGFTEKLNPSIKKAILIFGLLVVALGPILFFLGKMIVMLAFIAKFALAGGIMKLAVTFGTLASTLVGGAGATALFSGNFSTLMDRFSEMPIIKPVIGIFKSLWSALKDVGGLLKDIGSIFINDLISAFTRLANTKIGQEFFKFLNDEIRFTIELIDKLLSLIPSFFGLVGDIARRASAKLEDEGPLATTGLAPISFSTSGVPILPPAAMAQAQGSMSGKIIVETKDNAGVISAVKTESSGDVSLDTGNNMRGINS